MSESRCQFTIPDYVVVGPNNPMRCRYSDGHVGPHVFVWIPQTEGFDLHGQVWGSGDPNAPQSYPWATVRSDTRTPQEDELANAQAANAIYLRENIYLRKLIRSSIELFEQWVKQGVARPVQLTLDLLPKLYQFRVPSPNHTSAKEPK